MQINCLNPKCPPKKSHSPRANPIVRNGFFRRSSDSRLIQRFYCKSCKTHFSAASFNTCLNQKKRRINFSLRELLCSGVSQRRAARILKANRKTVVRRFRFLANEARLNHQKWVKALPPHALTAIQFDDMETSEHTKCKPLSVALAVNLERKILDFQVSQMPANGLLARKSIQKYGYRKDERSRGWEALMKNLIPITQAGAIFISDENPHYPKFVKKHHPEVHHLTVKGARGCIAGQGELKKLGFDPLFALNHTCAMLRANLNRLFRRTWCMTKTRQGLDDHLALYVYYHNQVLTKSAG